MSDASPSFPSKNLGTTGDGGIVTTNDDELAEKCRIMRVHGSKPRYYHHVIGGNFRLDPLHAAVLSVKLPLLDTQHEGRRKNAALYNQELGDSVVTPFVSENNYMIYNQYTIRHSKRDALKSHLESKKIGCMIYYPVPLHLQDCFSELGYKKGDCPITEQVVNEVMSLPVFPELTNDELHYVIDSIKDFIEANK